MNHNNNSHFTLTDQLSAKNQDDAPPPEIDLLPNSHTNSALPSKKSKFFKLGFNSMALMVMFGTTALAAASIEILSSMADNVKIQEIIKTIQSPDSITFNSVEAQHIKTMIQDATEKGYFSQLPVMFIQKVKSEGNNYANVNHAIKPVAGSDCAITITLNSKGHIENDHFSPLSEMQENTLKQLGISFTQEHEKSLLNEYVSLHEASHCEFNTIEQPILIDNDAALQKEINFYYKDGASDDFIENKLVHTGPYRLLNEIFADSYSLIQMIKKYEGSDAMLNFAYKVQAKRFIDTVQIEGAYGIADSHNSGYAIDRLMQPHILKEIANTSDPKALRQIALRAANYGLNQILDENFESVMSFRSLEYAINQKVTFFSDYPRYAALQSRTQNSLVTSVATAVNEGVKVGDIKTTDKAEASEHYLKMFIKSPDYQKSYASYERYVTAYVNRETHQHAGSISNYHINPEIRIQNNRAKRFLAVTKNFSYHMEALGQLDTKIIFSPPAVSSPQVSNTSLLNKIAQNRKIKTPEPGLKSLSM